MVAEGCFPERVRAVLTGEVSVWSGSGECSDESLPLHAASYARLRSPGWVGAIDLAERAARTCTTPSASIPVGTAVHTGVAFVGATGLGTTVEDFTALGDAVNITARLASAASAGEVIVSVAAAQAAGMATDQPERRTLEIRGRTQPINVIVLPRLDRKCRQTSAMSEGTRPMS
jgi:class 3 adenylate cyclase